MITSLPNWINLLFLLTVALTITAFHYSNGKRKNLLFILLSWSAVQSLLAYYGFYQNTQSIPPRFMLVLLPALLFIVWGLLPGNREGLLKGRNRSWSTWLHTIRIPVEIVLFYLFLYGMIPELMTFEGRNFDILAGLTAPIIGLLVWRKRAGNTVLLAWNVICLCLVSFILLNRLLSAELPIQQFGFEQPNKAVLYFPFVLLPAVIVPIVIFTHITDIIILLREKKNVQRKPILQT